MKVEIRTPPIHEGRGMDFFLRVLLWNGLYIVL
jgi:hypothetical protein